MDKVYIVLREYNNKIKGYYVYRCFVDEVAAKSFVINFLYQNSTLEDRTYNKINKVEFDNFTEYSLYTNFYGDITLRIQPMKLY